MRKQNMPFEVFETCTEHWLTEKAIQGAIRNLISLVEELVVRNTKSSSKLFIRRAWL